MREASRGIVGLDMLDMSAHVLRLIDVDHESRVWWEIQRLSRSMSARGFDERDSAESSTLNSANFPIRRYQAGPSVRTQIR